MRGTKLEGVFKKVKGAVVGQSEHTISISPKTGKKVTSSKRDVAWQRNEAETPQCSSSSNWPKIKKSAKSKKRANDNKTVEWKKASKWIQTANETDSTDETESEPIQPKIKVNETSEEDKKERQIEEAQEQQVTEKDIETTKEDDRETQTIPTTVPVASGSQSVPIKEQSNGKRKGFRVVLQRSLIDWGTLS